MRRFYLSLQGFDKTVPHFENACNQTIPLGQRRPEDWHYYSVYHGRQVSKDMGAWPRGEGAKKGPCGASTDSATGNPKTDRAGRQSEHYDSKQRAANGPQVSKDVWAWPRRAVSAAR